MSTTFRGGYLALNRQYIEQLPVPTVSSDQELAIAKMAEWLLWLYQQDSVKTGGDSEASVDPLIAAYFEQWVNGLVYELFFPEKLHAAQIRLFVLMAKLKLSEVTSVPEASRLGFIRKEFRRLYDENGPLRSALFTLGNLPEVRIIEGTT